jgi:hypothetical protein
VDKEGGVILTNIGIIEYGVLVAALNELCAERVVCDGCGKCPCDGKGGCLLDRVKYLIREHVLDGADVREVGIP